MHLFQSQNNSEFQDTTSNESLFQNTGTPNTDLRNRLDKSRPSFPPNTILQRGSRGILVKTLQKALVKLGFELVVDGIFGPQMEKTIRLFQKVHRLDIDGVAGTDTLSRLGTIDSSSSSEPTEQQENASSQNQIEHHVFSGESLWIIASQYYEEGSRWREIARANGLSDVSILRVGQKLIIPNTTQSDNSISVKGTSTSSEPQTSQPESSGTAEHHVFPGESLWVIASQYYEEGSRWREIARANGLSDVSILRVGQKLIIPNVSSNQQASSGSTSNHPLSSNGSNSSTSTELNNQTTTNPQTVLLDGMKAIDPINLEGLSGIRRSMAEIYNKKGSYLKQKAEQLGISSSSAAAVLQIESGGRGFASTGMIIRFENHIFWDQWGSANPDKFREHFTYSSNQRWKNHTFRQTPSQPFESFHSNQDKEWEALNFARTLSETGALKSISMGVAQIMGFNHKGIGYNTVEEMFEAMTNGLPAQIDGMFSFIQNNSTCMRGLQNNDFVTFASAYNGSGQAQAYGSLIASAEAVYRDVTQGRQMA